MTNSAHSITDPTALRTIFSVGRADSEVPFIHDFHGAITLTSLDAEENISTEEVGTISGTVFDGAEALNCDLDIWELADQISQEHTEVAEFAFSDNMLVPAIIGEGYGARLLYIGRMNLKPEFRGKGIGLYAIARAIELMGSGKDAVLMQAYPLQFKQSVFNEVIADQLGLKANGSDFSNCLDKLVRYYSRLGFELVDPNNSYMARLNYS